MKTILVPTESHESMRSALTTALLLARRFDSYIEGFALRFRVNEFIAVDMAGAIPLETLREESFDEARRARTLFEAFMREHAVPRPSAAEATQYLVRNGVKAEPMTVGLEGRTTGEAILAAAQSLDCDLLIKGAYTQSRLRQMIFGGATRHILAHATLPVLMAN